LATPADGGLKGVGLEPSASQSPGQSIRRSILIVLLPFAAGYTLSYVFRTVNAVLAPHLVRDIGLSAADLGLITAAYFLAFAAFQVPLGLLIDRFNPSRVQGILLMSAGLGALVFAWGEQRETLILGRAMIGLGVAGGLMASLKAIVLWFPRQRLPLFNGLFLAFGGLGAMAATVPVEVALGVTDWRGVYVVLGLATFASAVLVFFLVPTRPMDPPSGGPLKQFRDLGHVYRDRLFWRIAPVCVVTPGTTMAIQGLWAGPWLRDVAGLDRAAVANHLFIMAVAMTVGFAITALLTDILYRRFAIRPITVLGCGLVALLLVQAGVVAELISIVMLLWISFGALASFISLSFAILSQHFPAEYSGRANTGLNVMVFSCSFGAQYAIGAIIDVWPPLADGNYQPEAYQAAFGTMLVIEVTALLWFFAAGHLLPAKQR
jgi:MFS family permease|tara:strand:+ start:38 stop:1339 length:1302 start_codon:yes stop_codon:yes gene_type:complete